MKRFDQNWFEKHQKALVRFANSWIGHRFFGIRSDDVFEIGENFICIGKHYDFHRNLWVKRVKFFPNKCFSECFEKADMVIKRFVPSIISAGFLEPTTAFGLSMPLFAMTVSSFYPDAAPEIRSFDGFCQKLNANWATARGAAASDSAQDSSAAIEVSAQWNGVNYLIRRGIILFDTSSMGSGATINSATITLFGAANGTTNFDATNVDIVSSNPASNTAISTDDYDTLGTTVFSDMAIASWDDSDKGDNVFTLDANGRSNINPSGVSKFGIRIARDTDNSAPTGNNYVQPGSSDKGADYRPTLTVDYTGVATSEGAIPTLLTLGVG